MVQSLNFGGFSWDKFEDLQMNVYLVEGVLGVQVLVVGEGPLRLRRAPMMSILSSSTVFQNYHKFFLRK